MAGVGGSQVTGGQIRAARALLRWTADDLARESGVGVATIRRAETVDAETAMNAPNAAAVRRALEAAGVVFLMEGESAPDGGWGLRMRKDVPDDGLRPDELNSANDG